MFLVISVGIADGLKVINVGTVDIFKMVDAFFVVVRSVNWVDLSNFCLTFMLASKFSCFRISSEKKYHILRLRKVICSISIFSGTYYSGELKSGNI